MELVSVIISNYNYEQYISEAIESVLNQTYQNFELIIVDDGSIDLSSTTIKKYQDKYPEKIKTIFKENGGQGSAFNAGFKVAEGEIIAFLDADDYWYSLKLEIIVEAHKSFQAVQHNLDINNENKLALLSSNSQSKQKHLMMTYGFPGVIPTSGMSFKRDVLNNIFPIPTKPLILNADLYVRWYATFFVKWASIDQSLGCYRVHGKNGWFINKDMTVAKDIIQLLREKELPAIPYSNHSVKDTMMHILLNASQKNKRYVIYGTGGLGIELVEPIVDRGSSVCFFTDSNSKKWDLEINNIKVIPPSVLIEKRNQYDKIIVASIYAPEILVTLTKMGFKEGKDIIVPRF